MLNQNLEATRFKDAVSDWQQSFDLSGMKILVVCRGPVREEAFEVFARAGLSQTIDSSLDGLVEAVRRTQKSNHCLWFPTSLECSGPWAGRVLRS